MFWRLVWRGLLERKSRLSVALVALGVAGTLSAALLNLYLDAQQKIRGEFRRYGANLMISPHASSASVGGPPQLMAVEVARQLERAFPPERLSAVVPYLYAVVARDGQSVVLAGTWLDQFARLGGFRVQAGTPPAGRDDTTSCWVGGSVARGFRVEPGEALTLRYRNAFHTCRVAGVLETGAAEDSQVLADLRVVESLTGEADRLNVIVARVAGDATVLEQVVHQLRTRFPSVAVNPLRQVTEAEFHVVERIRWALLGTTLVVLVVTALCVLATMTALAFERQPTIGTMKALGASHARLSGLFVAEAALLAVAAGLGGFLAGILLARWLGETLFASSVTLRWSTLPLSTAITLAIGLVGVLLPLRLVRQTEPAVILRGE